MNDLCCPVCGNFIVYHLKNDKEFQVLIKGDDSIEELVCKNDNSNIEIYCSQDKEHAIPEELKDDIIEIAQSYGY